MPTTKTRTTKTDAKAAARKVTAKVKPKRDEPVLGDHPDTLGIIHRAVVAAAKEARAENDRLGIPTPVGKNGKVVYTTPPKKRGTRSPNQG